MESREGVTNELEYELDFFTFDFIQTQFRKIKEADLK
jgi:hypothetical protein